MVGIIKLEEWIQSNANECFFIFETNPSDGTKYTIHTRECHYGGLYVIVNEITLYRYNKYKHQLKLLCGNKNDYTYRATLLAMHWLHSLDWEDE